jgi:anti-sigma regulatory factor (Ser/Thr protein kinase)
MTGRAGWRLEPEARSAESARQLVRDALAPCPSELVETASLVVSELVTNAVLHARTAIGVVIELLDDGGVRLEVSDDSTAPPQRRLYSADSGTGRGLVLVDALTAGWGVDPRQGTDGKTVWAEFRLPG